MFRSKVLHKHKKLCFVLLSTMERDYDIKPGTLFRSRSLTALMTLKGNVDEDKVVCSAPEQGYLKHTTVDEGDLLMFIDVIYDPYVKAHFLRFLADGVILGQRFSKGETLAKLVKDFEKIDPEQELENA